MVSPRGESVDMPIDGTFVSMVDRDEFDPGYGIVRVTRARKWWQVFSNPYVTRVT